MQNNRKPIVVVGSITMDMVSRAKQIPRVGETVIGTSFQTTPGGKGANQAVAAARLGYPVEMVGLVGTDMYGQALLDNLAAAGVKTDGMDQVEGSSGLAPIFLAESGENAIIVIPGANGKVDCARIDRHADLIRAAGMVLFQLELPLQTLPHTLDLCAAAGVPVMLDPAPAAALPDSVWDKITWFTPNETEAAFYLEPGLSPEEAAADLLARGVRGVVLKRGVEGAFLAADGRAEWVPPFAVRATDTVGAGDCFNGAFAVGLLEGRDAWSAARFANAAAALSVTRPGAQASMPHRAEVDALVAANQNPPNTRAADSGAPTERN